MSFHPDSYDGFEEGDCCPYCYEADYDMGKTEEEFGISEFFLVTRCHCNNCGRDFALVEIQEVTAYGTIPGESIYKDLRPKSKSPRAKKASRPKAKRRF